MAPRDDQVEEMLRRALDFLRDEIEVTNAVLFGSRARGDSHEASDIDLAVFSPDVVALGLRGRASLAARLRLTCGLEFEPHFFPASALTDAPPGSFVRHILETGKRVV